MMKRGGKSFVKIGEFGVDVEIGGRV